MPTYNEDLVDSTEVTDSTVNFLIAKNNLLDSSPLSDSTTNTFVAQESVVELMSTTTPVTYSYQINGLLDEDVALAEGVVSYDLPTLIDRVNLTGAAFRYATLNNAVSDGAGFNDAVTLAWAALLAENMALSAVAAGNPLFLGALVDSLHALGIVETRLDALAAVSSALAMEGLIQHGWSVSAVDSATFGDALEAAARFIAPLVDSAAMMADVTNAVRLVAISSDTLALNDDLAGFLTAYADASDELLLYATVRLGGTEYAGWVLNTENKALSEYRNFPAESIVFHNHKTYVAGPGGIFEMTGTDDDGDPIASFVRTGLTDFGTGKNKRLPDVYIGRRGTGELVLKVITTQDNGTKVEDWYVQENDGRTGSDVRHGRFKPGRGLKSRYWQFEIHNKAGGDLELAGVALRPLILDKRT